MEISRELTQSLIETLENITFDKNVADFIAHAIQSYGTVYKGHHIRHCSDCQDYFISIGNECCPECGRDPDDDMNIGDIVILPECQNTDGVYWQEGLHARITGFEMIDGENYAIVMDINNCSWVVPVGDLEKFNERN